MPHSPQDSANQPPMANNAAMSTPTTFVPPVTANPVSDEQSQQNALLAAISGTLGDAVAAPEAVEASSNESGFASAPAGDLEGQQYQSTEQSGDAMQRPGPGPSADATPSAANSVPPLQLAGNPRTASANPDAKQLASLSETLAAVDLPQASTPAKTVAFKPNQPSPNDQPAAAPDAAMLLAQSRELGARNIQLFTNSAAHDSQSQPKHTPSVTSDGTGLNAALAQNSSADPNRSIAEKQQSIAQQIQPRLSSLIGPQQPNAVQPAGATDGNSSGSGTAGENASGQNVNHPVGQPAVQGLGSVRSSDEGKSSPTGDSSQSGTQASDASGDASRTSTAAATSVMPSTAVAATPGAGASTSVHVVAQAMAQSDAAGGASTASKPGADAPADPQPAVSTPFPASLPRSLNDVTQASQLYQRVGGAEMHIAMDTDLLGSIDLRAVVHQGSLSATIGVQRADVQTLLVNELPALQHSLAEKNLQVGQISVLAGNIGSGANGNGQPQQQQGRSQTSAQAAPLYRDDEPPISAMRQTAAIAAVALTGTTARLSVLA